MPERILFCAQAGFESARQLAALPGGHRALRAHGHSFVATVRTALAPGWGGFAGGEVDSLRERLQACVQPLDYRFLNEILEEPDDDRLAEWIGARLEVAGVERIGVRSAPGAGVDLDRDGRAHVWRRYRFEAAHRLPNVRPGHKCGRMHGHGFEVVLHAALARSGRNARALAQEIDRCWAPLHAQLHRACLNDVPGLQNPTSEVIATLVWQRIESSLPQLAWVTVHETADCGAHYDGRRYGIWTELALDSALRLRRAPPADPRNRVHGHTYGLRLHLSAALDQVLGWTVDFGDVQEIFAPVFRALDHHPLDELTGIEDADVESVARWVRARTAPGMPQLDRIDLYETPGCGAILSWGVQPPAFVV